MFTGHPQGLFRLFFIEMWERLAFYTMVGILLLYATREEMWSTNPTHAVYQVEWSPEGLAACRQQHIDYLPVDRLRADDSRHYPWPDGREAPEADAATTDPGGP